MYTQYVSVFSCPFDYLLIKDGRSSSYAENIGVFCGKYENVTVFSSREFLFIEFVTRSGRVSFDENSLDNVADYKFDRRGFNISYEFSTSFIRFGRYSQECIKVILCASEHICSIVGYCFRSFKQL